jgi:hypothetical protein
MDKKAIVYEKVYIRNIVESVEERQKELERII